MDETCDRHHHGRRDMINAFVRISDLACRAGVNEDEISAAHGQFFDGNVEIKDAFGATALLARLYLSADQASSESDEA